MNGISPAPTTRPYLPHLDGLRGAAALYVAFHHAANWGLGQGDFPWWARLVKSGLLGYGREGVAIFIVLSGFCLCLGVEKGELRAGFLARRARRILPPYYAALALSLALFLLLPELQHPHGTRFDTSLPPWGWEAWLPHLTLIHPFRAAWMSLINAPLWTVGLEWWLYACLPGVVAGWRRGGPGVVLGVTLLAGVGASVLTQGRANFLHPWYLALFSLGACATLGGWRFPKWAAGIAWGTVAILLAARRFYPHPPWFTDLCVAVACLPILAHPPHWLEWKWLLRLGSFSYSLYLTHWPALGVVWLALWSWGLEGLYLWLGMIFLGPTVSILLGYAFSSVIERRRGNGDGKLPVGDV